ncbi:MAG: right-handed parallel beta-helix repeat-containing protein, partial [Sedimentisphaerales bacterium]
MGGTTNLRTSLVMAVFLMAMACTAAGDVIYVDDDASLGGNGQNWATAYRYLQNGLSVAWSGDEIRVAQGIYKPDEDSAHPNGNGSRTATFRLKNGVVITGGYAGLGEPNPNVRDIEVYETILSGDIRIVGNNSDNSFNIVTGSYTDSTAVLDGFTITGGNVDIETGQEMPYGAGMFALSGSATLANCIFTGNSAYAGGGVCYLGECSPALTNCTFTGNYALIGGGLVGAGSAMTITNCTFTGNSGEYYGGAFYNEAGSATIINCIFNQNTSSFYGGAINELMGRSSLYNCLFTGNSCSLDGGAMYYWYESRPNLYNCTFAGNSAPNGNAIASATPEGAGDIPPSTVRALNCIFWDGGSEIFNNNNSFIMITYSDVQGGWPGTGNINSNPLFVNAAIGNYHLLLGSPCIDAGDNSSVPPSVVTDLDGNPRIIDGTVDMGAYEGPYQGFLLSAESVIVPEGGTATFTVAPIVDPLGTLDVTVTVESGDPDITVESGGLLIFDSTNYSQPQTVTLAAAEDADQVHGSTVILVSAPGVYPADVTAYELDSEGPTVLYVDCDASGANDGSSWENAFTDLREGLSFAAETFWVKEIRVAQGAYSPEGPLPDIRRASNPNPADGATGVSRTAYLSWTAGPDATSHDVYFGTTSPGMFQSNQTATTFDPGTMAYSTVYYWRIDEVGAYGTITGTIWSFRTGGGGPGSPPFPSPPDLSVPPPPLDRTATFQLINGVIIKGGYAGFGEPNADARNIEAYKTILSGDIGILGDISDNSYHVVTGTDCDETAVLDGFTITAGNANQDYPSPYANGGGMYNYTGSPTLTNCTFSGNSAMHYGGGMFNGESSLTVTNCIFSGNSADYGSGMYNYQSSPTVTNCTFSGNSAETGGGMCNWENSSPTVTNCTFTGNSAMTYGGGMSNFDHSSPTVTNCTFSGNSAANYGHGGGMSNFDNSSPTITNCTFSGNSAGWDGGGMFNYYSSPTLANCILWGNAAPSGPQIHNYGTSSATVTYSDVQGGWPGAGNINANPLFVDPAIGDYHLLLGSPCINAGDPDYIAEPNEIDL